MNYIKRNTNKILENKDNLDLKSQLNNYPYISKEYNIRFMDFDLFIEILDKKRVVGFLSLSKYNEHTYALNDAYVLKEFRGKHLLLKEVLKLLLDGIELSIKEPTHDFVEMLMHYKFGEKLNDNLVASALSFDIEDRNILYNEEFEIEDLCSTFLYDLKLSSPIYIGDIVSKDKCEIAYQKLLKSDEKYSLKFRQNVNIDDYFKEFANDFKENITEYGEVLINLKKNLPRKKETKIDRIIRTAVENKQITSEESEKYKKQLEEAHSNGNVLNEGLQRYLNYIVSGEDNLIDPSEVSSTACPNCHHKINVKNKMCNHCGWNISHGNYLKKDELLDKLIDEKLNRLMDEFIESEINEEVRALKDNIKTNIDDDEFETWTIPNTDLDYYEHEYYIKDGKYALEKVEDENEGANLTFLIHNILLELEKNSNIYEVFKELEIEDKSIIHELVSTELIESEDYDDIWRVIYNCHSMEKLSEICKKHGLDGTGKKDEMIFELLNQGCYDEFGLTNFELSFEGKSLVQFTSWIDFYKDHMHIFDYDDFGNYIEKIKTHSFEPQCERYLDKHLKQAYDSKDFRKILDIMASKSRCDVHFTNFVNALNDELQLFMISINPVYLDDLNEYNFLSKSNINNIAVLSQATNKKNLKKIFNKNWDKVLFDKKVISKKSALKYLNDAVNGKDLNIIENSIKKEFLKS